MAAAEGMGLGGRVAGIGGADCDCRGGGVGGWVLGLCGAGGEGEEE